MCWSSHDSSFKEFWEILCFIIIIITSHFMPRFEHVDVCVTLGGDSWRQVHDREWITGTLYPPRTVHLSPGLGHDGDRWSSAGGR